MNTEEKFLVLKDALTKACSLKDHLIVKDVAKSLGFTETEQPRSMTHEYLGADGWSIVLIIRSYDPSGPFQNLPDVNKFDLKLICDSSVKRGFSCSYED